MGSARNLMLGATGRQGPGHRRQTNPHETILIIIKTKKIKCDYDSVSRLTNNLIIQ